MMDITRKLELLANVKAGHPTNLPEAGFDFNWSKQALAELCAEALAEIKKLRTHERERGVYFIETPENWPCVVHPPIQPMTDQDMTFVAAHMPVSQSLPKLPPYTPSTISEREQVEKTLVEVWGNDIVRRVNSAVDSAIGKIDPRSRWTSWNHQWLAPTDR
jgi:hypothetical protein